MKASYQLSLVWFSVAILMMPLTYGQNETILAANFMNGNNAALNSRVYLFNPSASAGEVTVRVFTLPLRSGVPQELTVTPLSLGTLGARSALNIKLAEDILTLLGTPLPYISDGGNLTVEFTIGSDRVRGVAQVFTSDFAFGTYPLQGPESTGGTVSFSEVGIVNSSGLQVGALTTFQEGGLFSVSDSSGRLIAGMGNTSGVRGVVIQAAPNETAVLGLADTSGANILSFITGGFLPGISGEISTFSSLASDGMVTALLGGNRSTGGLVSVFNSSGDATAGMGGDSGLVFGTTKSFIIPDPNRSDRMIHYTSLEGPEAAIYVRGTATLASGEAYIEFPEHFTAMAVPSSITVTLTPRSAISMGLAAVDVTADGIGVDYLAGWTNTYSFDYVAYAVRKGDENYQVYLSKEKAKQLTGATAAMARGLAPLGEASKSLATRSAVAK